MPRRYGADGTRLWNGKTPEEFTEADAYRFMVETEAILQRKELMDDPAQPAPASHIPVFIPEAVQALTMGNLNGRAQSPTMAAAIPEMCFLCLRCPAASIPHRSPWSFVSI